MRLRNLVLATLLPLAASVAQAGDLSPEVQAKFIKVIVTSSASGKISCGDATLKAALEAQGVSVDSSAMVAWVTNSGEAKMLKTTGRLIIAGRRDLLSSACVVLEEEGGRPKLLLNTTNLKSSRVQLSDAVMKIGEKL